MNYEAYSVSEQWEKRDLTEYSDQELIEHYHHIEASVKKLSLYDDSGWGQIGTLRSQLLDEVVKRFEDKL